MKSNIDGPPKDLGKGDTKLRPGVKWHNSIFARPELMSSNYKEVMLAEVLGFRIVDFDYDGPSLGSQSRRLDAFDRIISPLECKEPKGLT